MNLYRILILTLVTYALISCGGAEERKTVYMEKAKASIEAGDLDKARIELKNVLQIDPKDGEAYYQLGTVFEQQKDYLKAYRHYLKAEKLRPDLLANHAKLGRFYLLLMNDTDKAKSKIDLILSKDSVNSDGLLLKATLLLREKNTKEAIIIAKEVIANEPSNVDAAIFLAALYVKDNSIYDAINVLDNALKINKDNEKLNKVLVATLFKNKDYERAEVIYKKFLERNPDNVASYNNLAAFYHQTDNKIEAEKFFRASIENDQNDVGRQLTLINYIRSTKGNDDAIKELKELIAKNNGLGELRTGLAELYILNGDKKSAIEVDKNAIKDFSEEETGVTARIHLASVYISDKDFSQASEVIEKAIEVSPNDPNVNLLRAKLALVDNDIERAIISLRIVTKETPDNVEAFFLLVRAYQSEDNKEQVRSTLNSAYENNRMNADALLKLAKYHLSSDRDQAEKIIDDYNNLKEHDYDGMSIKSMILNQKEERLEAHEIAEKMIDLYPGKPNGYLQAVPYYVQERDIQEVISILERGYVNAEDNRKILTLLTTVQGSDKQFDAVEKRIKAELDVTPDDNELKILLYKTYMAKNDPALAEPILIEVVNNNTELEDPYLWLAQSYLNKKDVATANSILMKGKANVVSSVKIPLALASIYEKDKSYSQAIGVYRELYQNHPDNLIIINNLASMLSDHGDIKADLVLVKTLADKLKGSSHPVLLDTVGWVYYKLGNYQEAIKYFTEVVEKSPDINVFNYHLGMAYKMSGNKEQAKVYLEKSLANDKQFREKELADAALKAI